MARIAGRGTHALDPQDFGFAPVEAARKALTRAGIGWSDVGAVELNEAFAVQSLACVDAWGIDPDIVNTWGGAIAIGHPLGASGARVLGTLAQRCGRPATAGGWRRSASGSGRQSDSWVFDGLYRAGAIELEVVPQGNLAERMRAAGAGIGAFFCPTGVGTPLAEGKEERVIDGRRYVGRRSDGSRHRRQAGLRDDDPLRQGRDPEAGAELHLSAHRARLRQPGLHRPRHVRGRAGRRPGHRAPSASASPS
jgi:hypothetical protein